MLKSFLFETCSWNWCNIPGDLKISARTLCPSFCCTTFSIDTTQPNYLNEFVPYIYLAIIILFLEGNGKYYVWIYKFMYLVFLCFFNSWIQKFLLNLNKVVFSVQCSYLDFWERIDMIQLLWIMFKCLLKNFKG